MKKESMLKIREFNQKSQEHYSKSRPQSLSSDSDYSDDDFWYVHINYDHPFLEVDKAPFTVMEDTSLSKIHFLFTMLNLSQLFVIRKGVLVGIITKNDFLKKKRMVIEIPEPEKHETHEMHRPKQLIEIGDISSFAKSPDVSMKRFNNSLSEESKDIFH